MNVPADVVLVGEETALLLLLLPNTAVTLTVQLLPAGASEKTVCVVFAPGTVSDICFDSVPHRS